MYSGENRASSLRRAFQRATCFSESPTGLVSASLQCSGCLCSFLNGYLRAHKLICHENRLPIIFLCGASEVPSCIISTTRENSAEALFSGTGVLSFSRGKSRFLVQFMSLPAWTLLRHLFELLANLHFESISARSKYYVWSVYFTEGIMLLYHSLTRRAEDAFLRGINAFHSASTKHNNEHAKFTISITRISRTAQPNMGNASGNDECADAWFTPPVEKRYASTHEANYQRG